ncbi:MAG: hypothetical protein HQK77_05745 [Desulfobacterales bacterium]|nr:hypothetical protein [Desulfobacterales bacterium]
MSWSKGLYINGLALLDDPLFSNGHLIQLDHLSIGIEFFPQSSIPLNIVLSIRGLDLHLIRTIKNETNIGNFLSKLTPEKTKPSQPDMKKEIQSETDVQHFQIALPLPFNIQSTISLSDISVTVNDKQTSNTLEVKNTHLNIVIPSLLDQPIGIYIASHADLNQQSVMDINVHCILRDLLNHKAILDLNQIQINLNGECAGSRFTCKSNTKTNSIQARIDMDLHKMLEVLKQINVLPEPLSASQLTGNVHLSIDISQVISDDIKPISVQFNADSLTYSGPMISDKRIGPIAFSVNSKASIDSKFDNLVIDQATIGFMNKNIAVLAANLNHINTPDTMEIKVALDTLQIEFNDMFQVIHAFIPDNMILSKPNNPIGPKLRIQKIAYKGIGKRKHKLHINSLELTYPFFSIKNQAVDIDIHNLQWKIPELDIALNTMTIETVKVNTDIQLGKFKLVQANQSIVLDQIHLHECLFEAKDVSTTSEHFLGICGNAKFKQRLDIKAMYVPNVMDIKNVFHQIDMDMVVKPSSPLELGLKTVRLTLPDMRLEIPNYGQWTIPLDVSLKLDKTILHQLSPVDVDFNGCDVKADLGKLLTCQITGDATKTGKTQLNTSGTIQIDLDYLPVTFLKKQFSNFDTSGKVKCEWNFNGRLPNELEQTHLKAIPVSFSKTFPFIDKVRLMVSGQDIYVDASLKNGDRLNIGPVNCQPLISYRYPFEKGRGLLSSSISTIHLIAIPKFSLVEPLDIGFSLLVTHDELNAIQLVQQMNIEPFGFKESIQSVVGGIQDIVKNYPPEVSHILSSGDIKINTSIKIKDINRLQRFLKPYIQGIECSGEITSTAKLDLTSNQRIGGNVVVNVPSLNISANDLIDIHQIQGNLDINKSYQLVNSGLKTQKQIQQSMKTTSLSTRVMSSGVESKQQISDESQILESIIHRSQQSTKQADGFNIEKCQLKLKSFPLLIEHSIVDLSLNNGLPSLDYFQIEVLGGTLLGYLQLIEQNNHYTLRSKISFSGIDASTLLSNVKTKHDDEFAVSGQVFLNIPLYARLDKMLQDLSIDIDFTHIGPKALSQLLYMLDPTESNESIVSQRKLLKSGSPKWIQIKIKDGNLSLEGEMSIKGLPIKLPRLVRLSISRLPRLLNIEGDIPVLQQLIQLLHVASAKIILIDPSGKVEFRITD